METDNFNQIEFFQDSGIQECGYFEGRQNKKLISDIRSIKEKYGKAYDEAIFFSFMLENGFRRFFTFYYLQDCPNCHECTPIRIPVKSFAPSKSQRVAWRKNQDLKVSIRFDNYATEEKAFLYSEYDNYHNKNEKGYEKLSIQQAKFRLYEMNSNFECTLNMEYRLNGKLIAVGILDYGKNIDGKLNSLSSNYFYYDVSQEILDRSVGVFSVLKEIELCKKFGIDYYYLGLYLPNCRKMNYKIKYKPYELLEDGQWNLYNE